jgi:hypothetical protein
VSPDAGTRGSRQAMVSSALYALYALAAWAALVQGTVAATLAGAGVAAYLLVRLAWSMRRVLAARTTALAPAECLPASLPLGPGRP